MRHTPPGVAYFRSGNSRNRDQSLGLKLCSSALPGKRFCRGSFQSADMPSRPPLHRAARTDLQRNRDLLDFLDVLLKMRGWNWISPTPASNASRSTTRPCRPSTGKSSSSLFRPKKRSESLYLVIHLLSCGRGSVNYFAAIAPGPDFAVPGMLHPFHLRHRESALCQRRDHDHLTFYRPGDLLPGANPEQWWERN